MRHCSPASFVFVASFFVASASAQEDLYEFLPPEAGDGALCGLAVAVHGSRFAVNSDSIVYVCDLETGAVLYQVTSPDGPGDLFGGALALSADYLLVGAPYAGASDGAVHVFHAGTGQPLGVWRGEPIGERFGSAIAIHGDIAVVGAPQPSTGSVKCGEVLAIDLVTGAEVGRVSLPSNQYGDKFGATVAFEGDYAVAGAPHHNANAGAAYVLDTATWSIARKIKLSGSDGLGTSVALFGERVAIGSNPNSLNIGQAFVFDVTNGDLLLTLEPSDGGYDQDFGTSVDMNEAGILVGARYADHGGYGTGAAYLFSMETGEQVHKFGREGGQYGDNFSFALALSERGIALGGAPYADVQGTDSGVLQAFRMPRTWYESPTTGHRFTLTDTVASWHEARQQAAALGGELATLHDAVENAWLVDVLPDDDLAHWIGLSDEAQEGTFVWASGEPFTFASWAPGQPDDDFGADWVVFDPITGLWRDEPEVLERRALVEVVALDCDGNGIPDSVEIGADPSRDWNGDGQLDTCVPPTTCDALPNSTGQPARIDAEGSPFVADDDLTLVGTDLPTDVLGYFLMSAETDEVPFFGGSAGVLCLGGDIARFNRPPQGAVLSSGDFATMEFRPHLGDLPLGIVVQPGEHWYFQLWFRDYDPLPTSNTTPGLDVLFR